MTESHQVPKIPEGVFTQDQIEKINGGLNLCSANEIQDLFANLQQNYETLVAFTSYVIERVADGVSG